MISFFKEIKNKSISEIKRKRIKYIQKLLFKGKEVFYVIRNINFYKTVLFDTRVINLDGNEITSKNKYAIQIRYSELNEVEKVGLQKAKIIKGVMFVETDEIENYEIKNIVGIWKLR